MQLSTGKGERMHEEHAYQTAMSCGKVRVVQGTAVLSNVKLCRHFNEWHLSTVGSTLGEGGKCMQCIHLHCRCDREGGILYIRRA